MHTTVFLESAEGLNIAVTDNTGVGKNGFTRKCNDPFQISGNALKRYKVKINGSLL